MEVVPAPGPSEGLAASSTVLEATGLGRWQLDLDGGRIRFDALAARLVGLTGEAGHLPLEEFLAALDPDDATRTAAALRSAARGGGRILEESRRPGETATWVRLRGGAVQDATGRVTAVLGLVADTTPLHAERDDVRSRLRDVSDGVLALDGDWTISYANPTAALLLGHTGRRLQGVRLWELVPQDVESPLWVNFHWAMRTQRPVSFEAYSEPAGGWLEMRAVPAGGGLTVYLRSVDAEHEAQRERQELIGRLERALSRGSQLLQLTEALSGQLTVQAVADTMTAHIRSAVDVLFASVALVDETGQWLEYVSLDSLPEATAEFWSRIPLTLDAPVSGAARLRRAFFHDSREQAEADFAGITEHMATAGVQSMVHIPLEGSTGAVLGTLAMSWAQAHPTSAAEREFLLTAAAYCTQALERAMLFEQQRTVAEALQRAVLPTRLPRPAHWQLSARYVAATSGIQVGGDWYDAFELPDGRLGVAVGDASGHGLPAARVMSSLRNALRAYALLGEGPAAVLTRLDRLLATLDPDALATVVYLELEPGSGRGQWAAAGHLPALWSIGGRNVLDEVTDVDPPLGIVGPDGVRAHDVHLGPGDGVLLYTDGLVERPEDGLDVGLDRLVAAADRVPGGPDAESMSRWLDGVVVELLTGRGPRDDICVLALRHRLSSPLRQVSRDLLPRAQAAGEARHLTVRTLTAWGLAAVCDTASLVVSELVTNAVTHAGSSITFRLEHLGEAIRVSVTDGSSAPPDQQMPDPSEEHGRGIQLVDLLSTRWGTTALADGKLVWAEVAVESEITPAR